MLGYSKKPLIQKLGIKQGSNIVIMDAPTGYGQVLGRLPKSVNVAREVVGEADFIHFFARRRAVLETQFPKLKRVLKTNGVLWISWPKGSSRVETDLNENVVREIGLRNGLVDVKVSAIDEVWSGIKFVYRAKDRTRTTV